MHDRLNPITGRRDILRVLAAGAGAAAASAAPLAAAAPQAADTAKKSRARYQENSQEVQTFYRVNRYPAK
jgi:ribosomal protein L12E/L44/L45/RPP1/RPP2